MSLTVSVNATLVSEDTSGVNSRMNDYFANNPLPSGITIENSGIMGLISDSLGSMITAIVIAVLAGSI